MDLYTKTKYINKYGLRAICNIGPSVMQSDVTVINPNDYKNIKNGDMVYVTTSALSNWFGTIYLQLKREKKRIYLMCGDSTRSAPLSIFHGKKDYFSWVMRQGVIIHWFVQNCDYPESRMVTAIPLGIDYHTISKRSYWGEPQMTCIEQDKLLQSIANIGNNWEQRYMKCIMDTHLTSHTNPGARGEATKILSRKSFIQSLPKQIKRSDYWRVILGNKYVISPFGKGIDCHRTWEAMALGSVPIVKRSSISDLFDGLDIIQVNNWNEVTDQMLYDYRRKSVGIQKQVTMQYWIDFIRSKINKISIPAKIDYRKHILLTGCIRNMSKQYGRIGSLLQKIKQQLSGYEVKVLFVESDSSDNTVQQYKQIGEVKSFGKLEQRIKSRTERLAYCRNYYLNYAKDYDMLMILDLDNNMKIPDNFKQKVKDFDKSEYVGIFGNSERYYDIWALRNGDVQSDCWCEIRGGTHKLPYGILLKKYVASHQKRLQGNPRYREVNSAFNSFGMYKTEYLEGAFYWGNQVYKGNSWPLCEHVYLNEMLRRQGYKLAIDVQMDWGRIATEHLH